MTAYKVVYAAAFLLTVVAAFTPCQAGLILDFQYSLPPAPEFGITVTGTGQLTTGDYDPILGGYPVIGISGTRSVDGVPETITGLIPPGGFLGNTNVLYYPNPPYLDFGGLAFTVNNPNGGDDGAGNVNVYYDTDVQGYTEPSFLVGYGTFDVVPSAPPGDGEIPEPAVVLLLGGGLIALGLYHRRVRNSAL